MNNYLDYFKYDEKILQQFKKYYELLIQENEKYNLTNITLIDEVYIKHFYDSLLLSKYVSLDNKTLVDIGSGAGFPGIPLKICNPNLNVILIEPTTKRANFLNMVINELGLENISVINDRCENVFINHLNKYDYVTARAVAESHILLELLSPFCKTNGKVILLKGSNYKDEFLNIDNCLNKTHLSIENIYNEILPFDFGERNIVILNKNSNTKINELRNYSQIKKKPL